MLLHSIACRFGKLDGRYAFPADQLSLMIEDNEQGKTTLVEAIIAGLYGYGRTDRRDGRLLERQRYLPVDGAECFVQLELTAAGRHLSLRRTLTGASADTVQVTDLDTARDVTAELAPSKGQTSPGEKLLGLTREQFLKVCFVRQGQVGDVGEGQALTDRVLKMVDTAAGQRTADTAIGALDDAMRHFQGITFKTNGLIDSEIRQLNERLRVARNEQAELRAVRDAVDRDVCALDALEAQDRADAQTQEALAFQADRVELARLEDERGEAAARAGEARRLREQIGALEQHRAVAPDSAARLEAAANAVDAARSDLDACETEERRLTQDLVREQERLRRLGPVADWTPRDRDELIAARERLAKAVAEHGDTGAAWQDALRNATPEARVLYEHGRSLFDACSDADRRTLLRYREERATLRAAIERLQSRTSRPEMATPARRNPPLLILGGVALLFALGLLAVRPLVAILVGLVGLALIAAGLLLRRAPALDEAAIEARALARRELAEAEARLSDLEAEGRRLAAAVRATSAAEAATALQAYLSAQTQASELRTRQQFLTQATTELKVTREKIADLCRRAEMTATSATVEPADADRLLRLVDDALAVQHAIEDLAKSQQLAVGVRGRAAAVLDECRQDWLARCQQLGLPESEPRNALTLVRQKVAAREQLARCETRLRLLDEQSSSRPPDDQSQRIRELTERIATASAVHPAFASLPVDGPAGAYLDESRATQARRDATQRDWQALRQRIGRTLDDFRARMPAAIDSEHETERRLVQVRQYRDALDLARTTLHDVAQESHRTWAEILNAHAGDALRRLAPNYPRMRFGEHLELRVLDDSGQAWSPDDGRLSAGARDRIYLAARLALAGYCSPEGDPLPLILDDPLVTSDDGRFDAAMRFLLAEVSTRHQVLLLSCHRQRHEALMQREPGLWRERVAVLRLSGEDPDPVSARPP